MPLDPYEVTASRHVLKTRFVDVREDLIRHGDADGVHYCVELPRAAVVLPVLDDGSVVMIRQWRHCVGRVLLELPAGRAAPGEPIEAAVARELEEETGFRAAAFEFLGSFFPLAGISDHEGFIFLAKGLTPGPARREALEHLETETVSPENLLRLLGEGAIADGFAQVALFRWFARRGSVSVPKS